MKNYLIAIGWEQYSSSVTPAQKCDAGTKYVTPVHIVILDYDLLKDNGKFSKPMISNKTMTKTLYWNFEKNISQMWKNGFKNDLLTLPLCKFFLVYIINK